MIAWGDELRSGRDWANLAISLLSNMKITLCCVFKQISYSYFQTIGECCLKRIVSFCRMGDKDETFKSRQLVEWEGGSNTSVWPPILTEFDLFTDKLIH